MAIILVLTASYMVAEVVGGLMSGSLALLADAGHMLSDAAAIGLALFAMWMADRPATAQRTYGYQRTEILAALVNGSALLAIAGYIIFEAIERFRHPPVVQAKLMMAVAAGGLLMNIVALLVLSRDRHQSLNTRGAWLHVISDALGSVGAIASGALIWAFGWAWADPLASVIIAVLVVHSAWALLKETVAVLMETAPAHIDVDELRQALIADDEVEAVHDLHVWTITSGLVCLSAHVVTHASGDDAQRVLARLTGLANDDFHIGHVTIQLEHESYEHACHPCAPPSATAA